MRKAKSMVSVMLAAAVTAGLVMTGCSSKGADVETKAADTQEAGKGDSTQATETGGGG